jgi:hypothetical protein
MTDPDTDQRIEWPEPADEPDDEPTEPWAKLAERKVAEEIIEWKEWEKWR